MATDTNRSPIKRRSRAGLSLELAIPSKVLDSLDYDERMAFINAGQRLVEEILKILDTSIGDGSQIRDISVIATLLIAWRRRQSAQKRVKNKKRM